MPASCLSKVSPYTKCVRKCRSGAVARAVGRPRVATTPVLALLRSLPETHFMMLMLASVLAAAIVAAQGSTTTGSIVGCILDTMQQPLPGATVVAKADGMGRIQRSAVTDGAGCYELKDLPLALYRVTVRLAAFDNVTRDRLIVGPAHPRALTSRCA